MSDTELAAEEVHPQEDAAEARPDNALIRIAPRQAANLQTVVALPNPLAGRKEVHPQEDAAEARPDNAVIRIAPRQADNLQTVDALPNPLAALMAPLAHDGSPPVLMPILDYVRELLTSTFPGGPDSTDLRLDIASNRLRLYESIITAVGILRNVIAAMARDLPMNPGHRDNFQILRTLYSSVRYIENSLRPTLDAEVTISFPTFLFTPLLGPHYFERGMGHSDALVPPGYWDENDFPDGASFDPPANAVEPLNIGILEENEAENNDNLEAGEDDNPQHMINEDIIIQDIEDPV